MRVFTVIVTFALIAANGLAQDSHEAKPETHPVQLQLEVRLGADFATQAPGAFNNIPASYRTVPWNPGDGNGQSTIAYSSIGTNRFLAGNVMTTAALVFKRRFALRAGVSFAPVDNVPLSPGNTGDIREVDIFSGVFQRGYGTSLVYNAVRTTNSNIPLFVPEAEVRVGRIGLLAGAWRRNYDYAIEQGYDRYDALQKLRDVPLGTVTSTHYYGGVRCCYFGGNSKFVGGVVTVGPANFQTRLAAQAAGAQAPVSKGLLVGLAFTFGGSVTH